MFQGEGTGSTTVDGVTEGADGTVLGAVTFAAGDAGTGVWAVDAAWTACAGCASGAGAVAVSADVMCGGAGADSTGGAGHVGVRGIAVSSSASADSRVRNEIPLKTSRGLGCA
jgi:hypothetical protein